MSYVIFDGCPPGCKGIDLGDGNSSGCSCKGNGAPCDCPNHVVRTVEKLGCDAVYNGPTFPNLHGIKCIARYHEHEDDRHYSGEVELNGEKGPLLWYTKEQKEKFFGHR